MIGILPWLVVEEDGWLVFEPLGIMVLLMKNQRKQKMMMMKILLIALLVRLFAVVVRYPCLHQLLASLFVWLTAELEQGAANYSFEAFLGLDC